ncbi:2-keto-4-pentenoate hydratase [Agromyces marinus]|uniref:4-oxalocrotonate decarboxylase n=1 Tax=Agromyces marinus TaxID=1389020 RepID=A0ABM8H0N9_9MICO|nr:fumarylacetoacetate hydrolase family protein [Agromyces marinus]UIP57553.1 4-oxalocrotonate decarboxylase [Agromyces marinus]BDZ54303.1 4-oxalocrotonate decarboxylase [Agromyces marinus]
MSAVDRLAAVLDDAQVGAGAVEQPSSDSPLDLATAYAVQHALIARRTARGERVIGLKLGFTSREKARQMGVHDVIIGTLTDAMRVEEGGRVPAGRGIHPRVEPEVAFLLGPSIGDPDADPATAIVAVAPALEVIDSRYRDFRFDLGDVIADNTSASSFAIGPWRAASDAGPLENRAVALEIDGRMVSTGSTAAILGDPVRAVATARRLARAHGLVLEAGSVLLAGAATAAVPLPARGTVSATIHALGRVAIDVDEEEGRR